MAKQTELKHLLESLQTETLTLAGARMYGHSVAVSLAKTVDFCEKRVFSLFADLTKQRDDAFERNNTLARQVDNLQAHIRGLETRLLSYSDKRESPRFTVTFKIPKVDASEYAQPFDLDKAKAGDPIQWTPTHADGWYECRFVGQLSNGGVIIETNASSVIQHPTTHLRMAPKQPQTVQMFANVYADMQGNLWGSLFPSVERAVRAAEGTRCPIKAREVPVTITVAGPQQT